MVHRIESDTFLLTLLDAAARLERRLDRVLSGTRGISFSEYRLLRELSERPGLAATRVELAGAVGLTPSAVSRALKPLEKLGYVTTEKSGRDARQNLGRLTDGGVELLSDAQGAVNDVMAEVSLPAVNREPLLRWLEELAWR